MVKDLLDSVNCRLLALVLVGCTPARAVEPPPAPVAKPAPPAAKSGRLVIHHFPSLSARSLTICTSQGCELVSLPPQVAAIVQTGAGRYLVSTETSTFELSARSGAREELSAPAITRLEDGSLIRYEHLSQRSRVFRKRPGENWFALLEYEKWRALEFRFLPTGAHLFKDSPGMGGQESPHFIDLVLGHPTHLYVVDRLGGKPRRVHTSSQQMDADFLDGGRRVAFWQPGAVNESAGSRTLSLQVLEVESGKVVDLASVTMPLGKRNAPETSSSLSSTWIAYLAEGGIAIDNAATKAHGAHPLGANEYLLPSLAHDSTWTMRHSRRWSDHLVIGKRLADVTELTVHALPSFTVVHRVRVPSKGLYEVEWVEDE